MKKDCGEMQLKMPMRKANIIEIFEGLECENVQMRGIEWPEN